MSKVLLETKGLKKSYDVPGGGTIDVLRGVDFAIHAGESISIRGESGSGKTTFLNCISALEQWSEGELLWQDKSVGKESMGWQASQRARFMGQVFQAYYLMPELNALENVVLIARLANQMAGDTEDRAKKLLERVGLGKRLKHTPPKLSGGERQRVALARALLNGPSLLLADEPTGNLDEDTARDVMELLLRLCNEEDVALVLVTHNPEFAKRAQKQLLLKEGTF